MPEGATVAACCERCPGATAAGTSHLPRRRLLKAAVFGQGADQASGPTGAGPTGAGPVAAGLTRLNSGWSGTAAAGSGQAGYLRAGSVQVSQAQAGSGAEAQAETGTGGAPLPRAITGRIIDVSPHFISIGDPGGEQRFALTADARAWSGGTLAPSAVRPGDEAVLRLRPTRGKVADRIWVNIGRVTGTIVEFDADVLVVDEGSSRGTRVVLIPPKAAALIRVKCQNLRPGYLIDLIGVRRQGVLEAVAPAAYQPSYPAAEVPAPPPQGARTPDAISGTATWHDPADEPHGLLGVSYPAIDPDCGCAEARAEAAAAGPISPFRNLPFLAVGSVLTVRNDCNSLSRTLPVTGCAPLARRFNDRCVQCGTSERGRIAELTLASFVALGGELHEGCFNATITIGR